MKMLDDLACTAIDPATLAQVRALFERQQSELDRQQAELAQRDVSLNRQAIVLAEKDFKITALTHELAYYRRISFGKASEALAGEQRLLFEDTVDADLAAIEEDRAPSACKAAAQAPRAPTATLGTAAHRAPPRAGILSV